MAGLVNQQYDSVSTNTDYPLRVCTTSYAGVISKIRITGEKNRMDKRKLFLDYISSNCSQLGNKL
ncbi:hypothetical protein SDJN02_02835, partial [Cucurbita argyrosperma subsp. argyrosperma]